jgi:hypothetical protein
VTSLVQPKKRVEILKQEVRCFSGIKDAEFELFNVNGFKNSSGLSVPGSSSSDYKFVVKVDTADISKWREGMTKFDPDHYEDSWTKEIVKGNKEDWLMTSQPTYYVREGLADGWNTTLVEFYSEGIVFKRVITN